MFLRWTPRILAIVYIMFISSFALDVFEPEFSIWALLIHLIPSFLLIIFLIVAWRRPLAGSILYLVMAAGYAIATYADFEPLAFLIVGGPLIIISALFLATRLAEIKIELVEVLDTQGSKTGEVATKETAVKRGMKYNVL